MSLGLFVQVAAHAATVPQSRMATMDCTEMQQSEPDRMHEQDRAADDCGPCKNMSFNCLVAMNCISPLYLPGTIAGSVSLEPGRPLYQVSGLDWLASMPSAPEPPPPEITS